MTQTFCPKHFTLEDIDCEEPIVACPPRVELDPTKHLIVTCGPCDRTRVVPIERVMKGTVQASGTCVLSTCAATMLLPDSPEVARLEGVVASLSEALEASRDAYNSLIPEPGSTITITAATEDTPASIEERAIVSPPALGAPYGIDQGAKPRTPKKAGPKS